MKLDDKNQDSGNRFFKNMPKGLLENSIPTMRNLIVLLDKEELETNEDELKTSSPSI